jgi:hypothetical protein
MFGHLIARGVQGGDVAQLLGGVPKKSLCSPWRRFHVWHSGRMHTPPPWAILLVSLGFNALALLP